MAVQPQVRVAGICVLWMVCSITLIMYNKWLLSYAGLHFPLAMVTCHLTATSIIMRLACWTKLADTPPPELSWRLYVQLIVPLGIGNALAFWLSNVAVMRLSVPLMQMMKAAIPTCSFLLGSLSGQEIYSWRLLGTVMWIGCGVSLASYGAVDFEEFGFAVGILALFVTSASLLLTQRLLQGQDIEFNPVTGNYYTAPVSVLTLVGPLLLLERAALPVMAQMPWHVLANACIAASLNLSAYWVLKETSAVTYGIVGQVKDWLNILLAVPVFGSIITAPQLIGYSLAVAGVFVYRSVRTGLMQEAKHSLLPAADEEANSLEFASGSAQQTKGRPESDESTSAPGDTSESDET